MAILPEGWFFNPPPQDKARGKDEYGRQCNSAPEPRQAKNTECDQGLHNREMDNVHAIADISPARRIQRGSGRKGDSHDQPRQSQYAQRFQARHQQSRAEGCRANHHEQGCMWPQPRAQLPQGHARCEEHHLAGQLPRQLVGIWRSRQVDELDPGKGREGERADPDPPHAAQLRQTPRENRQYQIEQDLDFERP